MSIEPEKQVEQEKQMAAEAAAELVENGMAVGLGTGSTVAFLLPALARRSLTIACVATSPRTELAARKLGLKIADLASIDHFDIAIDGADQITPDGWLVKGGGGALTREKVIARAADRFVVIADSTNPVAVLHSPIPLELLYFGVRATVHRIAPATLRDVPRSPDGGMIADYYGPVDDPAALSARLSSTPGVVEHGLFPPEMVTTVIVAGTSRSIGPISNALRPGQPALGPLDIGNRIGTVASGLQAAARSAIISDTTASARPAGIAVWTARRLAWRSLLVDIGDQPQTSRPGPVPGGSAPSLTLIKILFALLGHLMGARASLRSGGSGSSAVRRSWSAQSLLVRSRRASGRSA